MRHTSGRARLGEVRIRRNIATVLILLVLSSVCCTGHKTESEVNLSQIYGDRDTIALTMHIKDNHAAVRRALNKSLHEYLKLRGIVADTVPSSNLNELIWLVGQYGEISGVADVGRMLDIYAAWSPDEVRRRLILDSVFRVQIGIPDLKHRIQALHETRRLYGDLADTFKVAAVNYMTAKICLDNGMVDSSMVYALECLDACSTLGYRNFAGWSCLVLAKVHGSYRGDHLLAEEYLEKGADLFASIGYTRGLAEICLNRAHQRASRYETELAQAGFHRALSNFRSIGDQLQEGYCLYSLAETYYDQDQLDSAQFYAEQSLEVRRQLHARYAVESGHSFSSLGLISAARDDESAAERYYQQADSIFQEVGSVHGLCLNSIRMGSLALNSQDADRARERFKFAYENSNRFEDAISSLYGLAVCDYLQGDFESALDRLSLCIKRHESSSLKLPVPQAKTGLLSDRIGFYNLTAAIFAQQFTLSNGRHLLDSVFHYLERSKAQMLRDMIAAPPTLEDLEFVEPILDSIAQLDNALMLGTGDSSTLLAEMYTMEDSLERVRFELRYDRRVPGLASLCEPVDLNVVKRSLLNPGDLVLEYLVTEFGCYLIVLTNEELILREIRTTPGQLEVDVSALLGHIAHYPTTPAPSSEFIEISRRLYQLLIPPELLDPERVQRIMVVPDGPLSRLPFDALISHDGQYLIEVYDISYASSLTVLKAVTSRDIYPSDGDDIVIFADPTTDNVNLASLPSSRNEIKMIQNAFETSKIDVYAGNEASKAKFKSLRYTSTRYLFIATHGVTSERHASRSALVFASHGGSGSGLLQAAEIAAMDIPVDMVVLSACGTASGVSLPGEGVMNLAKPFLVAGALSVVATDWNVDDKGATRFVKSFYSQLAGDGHKLHSFSEAKRDFIHSEIPLYRHPYFWASWRLIGACK